MKIKSGLVSLLLLCPGSLEFLEARVPEETPILTRPAHSTIPPHAPDSSIIREAPIEVNLDLARNSRITRLPLPVFGGQTLVLIRDDDMTPSRKGSVIWSGHVDGQPASMATLVVGKEVLIGNVATQPTPEKPAEYYEIRYLGNRLHVLRQIDPTRLPPESDPMSGRTPRVKRDESGSRFLSASHWIPHNRSFLQTGNGDPVNTQSRVGIALKAAFRQGPSSDSPPAPPTCTSGTGSTIDVLVVYTSKAAQAANGADAMEEAIDLAIRELNCSYARSDVTQRLQLVGVQQVGKYVETGGPANDWPILQDPGGALADVHTIRKAVRADIVGLIVEYTEAELSSCGQAKVMEDVSPAFEQDAFAVVTRRCAGAPGKWSLAHEFGHLMGARHQWATDKEELPFPFSHGYVQHTSPGHPAFRTLMSTCNSCDRVPYWSNPDIQYPASPGDAMGSNDVKKPANNAKTLNKTAETVAKFR